VGIEQRGVKGWEEILCTAQTAEHMRRRWQIFKHKGDGCCARAAVVKEREGGWKGGREGGKAHITAMASGFLRLAPLWPPASSHNPSMNCLMHELHGKHMLQPALTMYVMPTWSDCLAGWLAGTLQAARQQQRPMPNSNASTGT
jgi:hypothetical protein